MTAPRLAGSGDRRSTLAGGGSPGHELLVDRQLGDVDARLELGATVAAAVDVGG
jgi:hypothetical protein